MSALKAWWEALSLRERRLVGAMLIILGGMILWLGIWRPVQNGLESSRTRYGEAVDTNASVRARMALLKGRPAPKGGAATGSMDQIVVQSAGELGLTLDRNTAQGQGRLSVSIGAARSGVLLSWLAALEERGISVETLSMTTGSTPGTVAVQAVLKQGAQ
jgi:general secretion pathway protein M